MRPIRDVINNTREKIQFEPEIKPWTSNFQDQSAKYYAIQIKLREQR